MQGVRGMWSYPCIRSGWEFTHPYPAYLEHSHADGRRPARHSCARQPSPCSWCRAASCPSSSPCLRQSPRHPSYRPCSHCRRRSCSSSSSIHLLLLLLALLLKRLHLACEILRICLVLDVRQQLLQELQRGNHDVVLRALRHAGDALAQHLMDLQREKGQRQACDAKHAGSGRERCGTPNSTRP